MLYQLHCCLHGAPRVRIFHHGDLGVVEGRYKLILQGGVDGSALVVHPSLFRVFTEDALLFPRRSPCLYVCRHSQVGWAFKVGARDTFILLGPKDDPKAAVLPSA